MAGVLAAAAPPPARLLSRSFVAVTAAVLVFFVAVGVLVPVVPTYVEDELRGGELGVGLALAFFAGAAIAARPLIGRAIERFGRRAVMVGGAALAAMACSLYGYVDALPLLLVLRAVSGVGEAALFVAAATLVADLSPAHRQAEASSYMSVAVFGGLGIGPVIGDAVRASTDYRTTFVLAAGFCALASVLSIAVPARVGPPAVDLDDRSGSDGARSRPGAFLHPAALGPGLVLASGVAAFSAFGAFLPDHSRSLGMSSSGGVFATYSATCLVLRVALARLPERLGPRRSVTAAFTFLGAGFAALAAIPQMWVLWASAGLLGAGVAFIYPSLMAMAVNGTPERERTRAVSSFTMFFEVGTAGGGLALGALADVAGKRSGFALAVGLCALGVWTLRAIALPRANVTAGRAVVGPTTVVRPARSLVAAAGD